MCAFVMILGAALMAWWGYGSAGAAIGVILVCTVLAPLIRWLAPEPKPKPRPEAWIEEFAKLTDTHRDE